MGTDVDMLYFICRDPRRGGQGHWGQMAGIAANVQRTAEPGTDTAPASAGAGTASSGCSWALIPWRMLSPCMALCKIKGGMLCFTEFRSGSQGMLDKSSFISTLPELTQDLVEGVWHTQGSNYKKKFVFGLTLGSSFWNFSVTF